MKQFFFYLITLWILLWGQVLNNHFSGGSWVSIDFILIASLYFGLMRGPLVGQVVGLLLGLMIDAASLGLMGLHALLYAAAGYLAGLFRRQLDETKPWTQSIFTFLISLLYVAFYLLLDHLFSSEMRPLSWRLLLQPFTNAVVAPVVFWGLDRWSMLWDIRREETH